MKELESEQAFSVNVTMHTGEHLGKEVELRKRWLAANGFRISDHEPNRVER
ncbi:hypothetical protein B0G84_8486 [Paraburkholderia sp. BL8N3]|nr:hypothetical protein [Paraburkholderia sp. BL8N3]TCK32660.1 hypothetical protein B0G84_8486 [Paraburkholderia sp. BL8N3]